VQRLALAPRTRVALVSGRPIGELRRFLDVPGIYYVGVHGAEVRCPTGELRIAHGTDRVRAALPEIRRHLQQTLGARRGIMIEDKGVALACHYRLAAPIDAMTARRVAAALAEEHRRRGIPIALVFGHEVAELRPAHVNKGRTTCALLAAQGAGALPVYIGDDQTDEDAFALLPPGTITIRVAPPNTMTRACYQVREPSDVHRFLRHVLESRAAHIARPPADAAAT